MIDGKQIDKLHQQYWNTCILSNYGVCCKYFTGIDIDETFRDYFIQFEKDFMNPHKFFTNQYLKSFLPDKNFAKEYSSKFINFLSHFKDFMTGKISVFTFLSMYAWIFVYHFHILSYPGYFPFGSNFPNKIGGYTLMDILHNNIQVNTFKHIRKHIQLVHLHSDSKGNFPKNILNMSTKSDLIHFVMTNEALLNTFDTSNGIHSLTIYFDVKLNDFFKHDTNNPSQDALLNTNWDNNHNDFLLFIRKSIP